MAKLIHPKDNPRANPQKPWTVRYQDNGRQRERSYATKGEAEDFKAKFEHDSRAGIFVDPRNGSAPFVEYARTYIAGFDKAEGTRAAYLSALENHIAPAVGRRTLAQVAQDLEGAEAILTAMREAGKSAVIRGRVAALIRGTLDKAVAAGRITSHRMATLTVKRDAAVKPVTIIPATREQLEALAAGLRPIEALSIWLMYGCGLRIAEALAVRLDAFREGGRVLRVTEQANGPDTYKPLKAKRAGQYRDVPVPAWLWEKVTVHAKAHGTDGYLFPGVTRFALAPRFARAAKALGMPTGKGGMHPHMLRHLYATTLLAEGLPITDVARWLGHASVDVTYGFYSHFIPSSWDRAYVVLDSLI
jgi:integrase